MAFDIEVYLRQKADASGCRLIAPPPRPDHDSLIFILAPSDRPGIGSALSMSGIELLQAKGIKSLCDARFKQAIHTLKRFKSKSNE